MQVIIRYHEISLKGKNRLGFEHALIANIIQALKVKPAQVKRIRGQITIRLEEGEAEKINKLREVLGIAWYAKAKEVETSPELIKACAVGVAKREITEGQSFAVRVKRADKTLPYTSMDLEKEIGEAIREATGARVNLTDPDYTLGISLRTPLSYVFSKREKGPGGLPVGTTGKVLALLSGGFDSIAASYLLAKRGAQVDYLHFHVFNDAKPVLNSKVESIARRLHELTHGEKMFLASYVNFQMGILDLTNKYHSSEVVMFRRLMVKVAEKLARKYGYQAIVTGDSLGQVASQTMENIVAVEEATTIPIFRPLIGMDKGEIIQIVEKVGLGEEAILPYKDCCSLIQKHPSTRVNLEKIKEAEEKIGIDKIAEEIFQAVKVIPLDASEAEISCQAPGLRLPSSKSPMRTRIRRTTGL